VETAVITTDALLPVRSIFVQLSSIASIELLYLFPGIVRSAITMSSTHESVAKASPPAAAKPKTYRLMARAEIEALIADGRSILIVDQHVLKVDPWLKYHPGGDKAIMHMVGRDATDEVTVYAIFSLVYDPGELGIR
jgi:hypothetical protein